MSRTSWISLLKLLCIIMHIHISICFMLDRSYSNGKPTSLFTGCLVQKQTYCKNSVELASGASVNTVDKCAYLTLGDARCTSKYFHWGTWMGGHCKCAPHECEERHSTADYSIYSAKSCTGMLGQGRPSPSLITHRTA